MKLIILCFVAIFCVGINGNQWQRLWSKYKTLHKKKYENSTTENSRFQTFLKNEAIFQKHNEDYKNGKVSYKLDHNKYTDLTPAEAKKYLFTLKEDPKALLSGPRQYHHNFTSLLRGAIPASVDWVAAGAVTSVKDQDLCGACYAFSVVGAVEGMHYIQYKRPLTELSVQNVIDCSIEFGNNGCSGGSRTYVYRYIKDRGGINTAAEYPYVGPVEECKFKKATAVGKIKYHGEIPKGDEKAMQAIVANFGPVSAGIDGAPLLGYREGIFESPYCNPNNLNHAVLVVGYGTENGKDYWLVKNSWGTGWGLDGYMKLARNKKNQCGIASISNYPIRL